MRQDSAWRVACRGEKAVESAKGSLDEVLREGARRMLQEAIEVEVADYVDQHQGERTPDSGRRLVVRNGRLPAREILSAAEKCAPHVVVLGIVQLNATPAVRQDVDLLASGLPAATELWVGGSGAAGVINGAMRRGVFVLEDLADFERHLTRWKAVHSRESAQ